MIILAFLALIFTPIIIIISETTDVLWEEDI
jgi:hypothetical protein